MDDHPASKLLQFPGHKHLFPPKMVYQTQAELAQVLDIMPKLLKSVLWSLNRDMYGNLMERVKVAYDNMCTKQTEAVQNPYTSTFEAASDAWEDWHHISGIEEHFYYQKSRIQWLRLGDQNTNFFYRVTQSRNSKNTIRQILSS